MGDFVGDDVVDEVGAACMRRQLRRTSRLALQLPQRVAVLVRYGLCAYLVRVSSGLISSR